MRILATVNLFVRRIAASLWLFAGALFLSSFIGAEPAWSQTTSCSALSSPGIVFSSYDTVTKAAVDGVGTITFTCTGSGAHTLNIVITGGNAGVCSPRQMKNGTAQLSYNIYKEAARSNIWCDSGSRLDVPIDYATGATQTRSVTMYGRVTGAQSPTFGTYTDSLSMQLKQGGGTLRTSTISVSGPVSPVCSVSAGTLGFPSYSATAAVVASANLSINCSSGAGYQVSLGSGLYMSGSTRRMVGPSTNYLNYELYRDSARTLTWGDGTALGSKVGGTGSGAAQTLTVYGRIPAGQYRAVGSYTDTVLVTIEY
jgi:spore coat protein U-like protein